MGSVPGWGTKILHAPWHSHKKKKKRKREKEVKVVSIKKLGWKSFQTFIKPHVLGPGTATKNAELSQTQPLSLRSSKSSGIRMTHELEHLVWL